MEPLLLQLSLALASVAIGVASNLLSKQAKRRLLLLILFALTAVVSLWAGIAYGARP
ncbi:MAG TPA: hypothetical protein VJ123_04085 [Anaerolineales bacterium]|nr:hypothetical protein [Anaerolineales bacterium]